MKKLFTLIAVALIAMSASAQTRTTLWEGEQIMDNSWPNVQVKASEFVMASVGDFVVVTASGDNSINAGWEWGPQVFVKLDWADAPLWNAQYLSDGDTNAEIKFEITAEILERIKAGTELEFQGMNVKITKIELEASLPTVSTALWEGECEFGTGWDKGFSIEADKFASVKEGDIIEFVYTTQNDLGSYYQFKTIISGTDPVVALTSNASDLNSWDCTTVAKDSKSYKFALNATDLELLKVSGMYVSGYCCIVTKVNIIQIATSISSVNVEKNVNAPIYNLSGQRVDAQYKGVVIQNGKKFLQK